MNLVIDIGNTRTKAGLFEKSELIENFIFDKNPLQQIKKLLTDYPQIRFSMVSSVLSHSKEIINFLQPKTNCIDFTAETKVPINILYKTPETLGRDRLSASVGAHFLHKNSDVLSIDAGTCLKLDFVTKDGNYLGGSISPGIEMRFKALNSFTDKLPHAPFDAHFKQLIGQTTMESIQSGVQQGILNEVDGYIDLYKKQYPEVKVVVTGGDLAFFENGLKNRIFASPNLVMIGLNEILNFNVS